MTLARSWVPMGVRPLNFTCAIKASISGSERMLFPWMSEFMKRMSMPSLSKSEAANAALERISLRSWIRSPFSSKAMDPLSSVGNVSLPWYKKDEGWNIPT